MMLSFHFISFLNPLKQYVHIRSYQGVGTPWVGGAGYFLGVRKHFKTLDQNWESKRREIYQKGTQNHRKPGICASNSFEILNPWKTEGKNAEKYPNTGTNTADIPDTENSTNMRAKTAESFGICSNSFQILNPWKTGGGKSRKISHNGNQNWQHLRMPSNLQKWESILPINPEVVL